MTASRDNLKRLLAPRSVAFIGGRSMALAARRCQQGGFEGSIFLVNPQHTELEGMPCIARIEDLPCAPDGVFLGVNQQLTLKLIPALRERGAGGIVCYASGFAETGAQGRALQEQLIASAGPLALLGPNCYGLVNYLHGVSLWPVAEGGKRVLSGAAILTQSGNFAYNLSMNADQFPIAYLASVGNQGQLGVAELMDAMLDDPRVTAIGLHLEGLNNVPGFAAAAYRALQRGVPVVALKTGVSEKGAALALGHTSSLAGSDALYDALFERLGVMRVGGVAAFIETMKAATANHIPAGPRIFGLACSGGDAGLMADHADTAGLCFSEMQEQTQTKLAALLPAYAQLANPLDFTTAIWGNEEALASMMDAVLAHESNDALVLALDFPSEASGERPPCQQLLDTFVTKVRAAGRAALVAPVFPGLLPTAVQTALQGTGVLAFQSLELGLAAWGRLARYTEKRPLLLARAEANLPLACQGDVVQTFTLSEWESREALQACGVPFGPARRCKADQAVQEASTMAFPLVLKAISRDLPHKTEAGGVALNLHDTAAVAVAVARMSASLAAYRTPVVLEDVLLEPMAKPAVAEILVGVRREPGFGLALVIGAGGILVELMQDSCSLLLPTNEQTIREALMRLKIAPVLAGFRQRPGVDLDAAVQAILAIARYALSHAGQLVELEVNPLLLHTQGCTAVDALITLDSQCNESEQQHE